MTRKTSILLICVAIAAYGCNSSPTAPDSQTPAGNGLTVVFKDPGAALAGKQEAIGRHIEETFERAMRQISLAGVTVEVTPGPQNIIPGWGVGGRALNGFAVELAVDPGLSSQLIEARLPSIVAHEFHHVARFRGPGYGGTLLEAMVSEGMADHYASELFGQPLPPWVVALSETEIPVWIERARPQFDSGSYSHSNWFFGTGSVPNWTGYTIGFELVRRYKAANPGSSAVTLVNSDADLFRP